MSDASQTLLVVDPAPKSRLALVAALRERWTVVVPDTDEAPVRCARKMRPAVVLLVIHRGELSTVQRTARILKTEAGTPPRVGLLDPRHRVRDAAAMLEACGADGYLGGRASEEQIRAFTQAVVQGRKPQLGVAERTRLLDRLRRR